jgi:hypothetical protein
VLPVDARRIANQKQEHHPRTVLCQREREHWAPSDRSALEIYRRDLSLETAVKYLPRPRPWGSHADYVSGEIAVVLSRG